MDWENAARTKYVNYKTQTLQSGAEPATAGGERRRGIYFGSSAKQKIPYGTAGTSATSHNLKWI